ncbi:hypothetical protein NITGR_150059 [Nitrospina gracilis 3/211]|uniref:Uncharacterized protein n=1 Tax=Nitrospina gracilis (strain 3/211) TaxID=1266370 RepID=M1YVR3_NITG3|nr:MULTISPECIES: hypothetical protein [Nitrospina]MCF8722744.1 hypothetical protein [Nitrospina sp. Nb-3]CCQ89691.1 hypothetical protein NITGR_150059 [Nitrospina gracilis 3/211]
MADTTHTTPQTGTPRPPQKKKFFRYLTYKEPRWFHIFIHTGFLFAIAIALILIGVALWMNPELAH